METIVRSEKQEVRISFDLPFVIIGEKINPTGNKKVAEALKAGDFSYIADLAEKQVDSGADIIGVNVGVPGMDQVELLPKVARYLSESIDAPLCIDSSNKDALKAALAVVPGRPLVNSVNGEEKSLEAIIPLIKEFNVPVVGLLMDDNGIPQTVEARFDVASKIISRANEAGIETNNIVIDPLVLSVGAQSDAAAITLKTIQKVREGYGVNFTLGASNVSFGMPDRLALNEAFMALAMGHGVTSAITDPIKMTKVIRSTDLMLGRDSYGVRFIEHFRKTQQQG